MANSEATLQFKGTPCHMYTDGFTDHRGRRGYYGVFKYVEGVGNDLKTDFITIKIPETQREEVSNAINNKGEISFTARAGHWEDINGKNMPVHLQHFKVSKS